MANELKSCPFCGWPDPSWHVERHAYDWVKYAEYAVHCGNCDAESVMAKTREEAAAAWNRRAPAAVMIPSEVREAIRRLIAYGIPVGCTNADWIRWRETVTKWLDAQPTPDA